MNQERIEISISNETFLIRLGNFSSSLIILIILRLFYFNSIYFRDFFAGTRKIIFDEKVIRFTSFDIFQYLFWGFVISCFLFYFFEREPKPGKSLITLRVLKKIFAHPVRSFQKGINKQEKVALLSVLLKAFYIPLMTHFWFQHVSSLSININFILNSEINNGILELYKEKIYWIIFDLIFTVDVFFFVVGYMLEFNFLKNKILSVETTAIGWIVALICYPPFNGVVGQLTEWPSADQPIFRSDTVFVFISILMLISFAIYASASIALGFKASNLTHRGIVSRGPYAYVRHPAYVSKCFSWWLGSLPIFILAIDKADLRLFVFAFGTMFLWSAIYFLRALTEERHLRSVNDQYEKYAEKVKFMFIPGLV